LEHAKGLIAAWPLAADRDNLVITFLVQQKNPVSCYHIRCCRSTVGASVSLRSWYYWLLLAEDI